MILSAEPAYRQTWRGLRRRRAGWSATTTASSATTTAGLARAADLRPPSQLAREAIALAGVEGRVQRDAHRIHVGAHPLVRLLDDQLVCVDGPLQYRTDLRRLCRILGLNHLLEMIDDAGRSPHAGDALAAIAHEHRVREQPERKADDQREGEQDDRLHGGRHQLSPTGP